MAGKSLPSPVVVIPGITATNLHDWYSIDPELIWGALPFQREYDRIAMHPDNLVLERVEPALVAPHSVFGIVYKELILELRENLSPRQDHPVPVFPFAYDWRQPLERTEAQLAEFIEEAIERTRLLPHYHKSRYSKNPRASLVGHSMGGLIIAGYLEEKGTAAKVDKVVTLGSPFQGSHEAILKVTTGTAELGTGDSSSRERKAARVTPALYHLLPSYPGAVVASEGLSSNLYSPDAWQPSILGTIAEYVRLFGLDKKRPTVRARDILKRMLKQAKDHRKRLDSFTLSDCGLTPKDWLCVVGVGAETRIRLEIEKRNGKPFFNLTSRDRKNGWKSEDAQERIETGDGTVPFQGACPLFLPAHQLVCVSPDDFGYWELGDRILAKSFAAGFHGTLPKMNLAHRLIVSHFREDPKAKGIWGRRPPNLDPDALWEPPIKGLPEKS